MNHAFLDGYLSKSAAVSLDLEVGDVILTGRYKNKRTIVEELGVDELGQPTVNGMKLLALRIEKEMPEDKQSRTTQDMAKQAAEDPIRELAKAMLAIRHRTAEMQFPGNPHTPAYTRDRRSLAEAYEKWMNSLPYGDREWSGP